MGLIWDQRIVPELHEKTDSLANAIAEVSDDVWKAFFEMFSNENPALLPVLKTEMGKVLGSLSVDENTWRLMPYQGDGLTLNLTHRA